MKPTYKTEREVWKALKMRFKTNLTTSMFACNELNCMACWGWITETMAKRCQRKIRRYIKYFWPKYKEHALPVLPSQTWNQARVEMIEFILTRWCN